MWKKRKKRKKKKNVTEKTCTLTQFVYGIYYPLLYLTLERFRGSGWKVQQSGAGTFAGQGANQILKE